jgi:hypothetical protein
MTFSPGDQAEKRPAIGLQLALKQKTADFRHLNRRFEFFASDLLPSAGITQQVQGVALPRQGLSAGSAPPANLVSFYAFRGKCQFEKSQSREFESDGGHPALPNAGAAFQDFTCP